jgi:hypothetical protein
MSSGKQKALITLAVCTFVVATSLLTYAGFSQNASQAIISVSEFLGLAALEQSEPETHPVRRPATTEPMFLPPSTIASETLKLNELDFTDFTGTVRYVTGLCLLANSRCQTYCADCQRRSCISRERHVRTLTISVQPFRRIRQGNQLSVYGWPRFRARVSVGNGCDQCPTRQRFQSAREHTAQLLSTYSFAELRRGTNANMTLFMHTCVLQQRRHMTQRCTRRVRTRWSGVDVGQ